MADKTHNLHDEQTSRVAKQLRNIVENVRASALTEREWEEKRKQILELADDLDLQGTPEHEKKQQEKYAPPKSGAEKIMEQQKREQDEERKRQAKEGAEKNKLPEDKRDVAHAPRNTAP